MSAMPFDLAQEYEALVQFLYIVPVGLVQANLDGEIAMINPLSAQLLMPLSPDGNLTNLFTALESVAPDLRHLVHGFAAPYGMVCDGVRIPLAALASKPTHPAMLSLTLLKLDQGRIMAVINDITQQVVRERLFRQNEAWLNAIMVGVTDYALIRLDSEGCVEDWNPSISRITGFSAETVVGRSMSIFYPSGGTTEERVKDRLREADESGWSLDEGWRIKAGGDRFWGSAMIVPLDVPAGTARQQQEGAPKGLAREDAVPRAYSLVIRDITDKRDASEAQRKAIACDHLTGIGNRRTFFEAGELEFTRGKRHSRKLSLLILDVDRFKGVNDRHGHPAGDAVLRAFASLLSDTFRDVDVVARIGGEEFAVLMPSTDGDQAEQSAERLRRLVEKKPVAYGDSVIHYTVSGGIATVETDATDLDTLVRRADAVLYAAKDAGRNRIMSWRPADAPRVSQCS